MKPTEELIKLRSDKRITSVCVVDRWEAVERKKALRIFLDVTLPFTGEVKPIFIDAPIDIVFEDYTKMVDGMKVKDLDSFNMFWHEFVYPRAGHQWLTFLKRIRKDKDFHFKVRINNNWERLEEIGWSHHQLFGIIPRTDAVGDDEIYLLQDFCGPQNTASPVRW